MVTHVNALVEMDDALTCLEQEILIQQALLVRSLGDDDYTTTAPARWHIDSVMAVHDRMREILRQAWPA